MVNYIQKQLKFLDSNKIIHLIEQSHCFNLIHTSVITMKQALNPKMPKMGSTYVSDKELSVEELTYHLEKK